MSPHGAAAIVARAAPPSEGALQAEVIAGLCTHPKRLSPKYFYDELGSQLFDRICELPEYYLTRTEIGILEHELPAFGREFGAHARVIEPGSGASLKTRILLDALRAPAAYVPVDISPTHLEAAAEDLRTRYPGIDILPVCADFTQPFEVSQGHRPFDRTLVFFPGSTIGNFDPKGAVRLLEAMGRMSEPYGALIVGVDLKKDPHVLEAAYNDSEGVTAAFNLNALAHLNRRFNANFNLDDFAHCAFWNARASRIEMHLVSGREQTVTIGRQRIVFARDETIWTESCYKYDRAQFAALARRAGLRVDDVWMDNEKRFSVQVLRLVRGDSHGEHGR